jgi:hypothetical protein
MKKNETIKMQIDLLKKNKLNINLKKNAEFLEKKGIEIEKDDYQFGWLYTGDGHKLLKGEEYYSVYKKDSFFIKKEIVDEKCLYGSDYYHTRYKFKENAEKFILDCEQKSFNQFQIKHACIHIGINYDDIEKLYLFLEKKAI